MTWIKRNWEWAVVVRLIFGSIYEVWTCAAFGRFESVDANLIKRQWKGIAPWVRVPVRYTFPTQQSQSPTFTKDLGFEQNKPAQWSHEDNKEDLIHWPTTPTTLRVEWGIGGFIVRDFPLAKTTLPFKGFQGQIAFLLETI